MEAPTTSIARLSPWLLALLTTASLIAPCVLLVEVSKDRVTEVLNRLREVTPLGQTFSGGVATWDGEETSDALVARADVALYAAKTAGRDCMVTAEPTADPDLAHIIWGFRVVASARPSWVFGA